MQTLFYSSFITTQTTFSLDSTNVTSITDYNNGGDNPGTACDNKNGYLNLDMTAVPDNSFDLEVSAYSQSTTLPDPKFDLETDGGVDNQESDVTALGQVSAQSYWAQTNWHDYRDGGSGDSGKFQAQFDISAKGWSDYNVCVGSTAVQAIQPYGDNLGQP